jgi:exopolysaccharide production protein ExoZ
MRENIASIQFLRFVAATVVVLFHSTQAITKYFAGSTPEAFRYAANFGESGVHIFFVISGFIMVYTSFHKKTEVFSPSKFLVRRVIRIYPIYFIYASFYLSFYQLFAYGKMLSLEQLLGSLLLIPGYSSLIIGPGWTLSYEVYFYFWFGLVMACGLGKGLLALTSFFLASIAMRSVLDTNQPAIHVFTNPLLIEFLLGVWIGYAVVSDRKVSNKLSTAMILLAFVGFLAGFGFGFSRLPSVVMWAIPSALLVAGLVFKENNGYVSRFVRKYSFLGDSSYSLYLLHIVLIDAVLFSATHSIRVRDYLLTVGSLGMIPICFAIAAFCIAVSFISYEFIERRVVSSLQDLFRRFAPVQRKQQAGG